jgi:peptidoglycan-N-acetylglucosamine deacetylase
MGRKMSAPTRIRPIVCCLLLGAALLTVAGCSKAAKTAATTPAPAPGAATSALASSPPSSVETEAPKPLDDLTAETADAVRQAAEPFPNAPAVAVASSINHAHPRRKLVSITLDDGLPFDMRILDMLEREHITATTFLIGQVAAKRPDLMARLQKDGFEIADHTWDHKTLTKLTDAQIRDELLKTQKAISKVTGNQAPYLRPPGGGTNARVKRIAASMGYKIVLWNRSFADTSKYATPEKLFHNVMDHLKPGDVILCHWGGKSTYEALQLILPELKRRGYETVPLSEMLRDSATSTATP